MVMIRLARGGAVRRPFYHIVVTNRRSRRDGRNIERLGFYNPVATGQETELKIDLERVDYWLSQGAKPSETVARLLKSYRKAQAQAA